MPKLKIAILTHEFPPMHGGVGISSYRISQLLKAIYDVHVVHFVSGGYGGSPEGKIDQVDGVTVHRLHVGPTEPSPDITRPDSSFKDVQAQRESHLALELLQRREGFEVMLTLFFTNFGHIATLVAKKHKIPHVISIRGNDIGKHFFMSDMLPHMEYVLRNADHVTSVNQELLDIADTIAPIRKKSTVIHNSVDMDLAREAKEVSIPGLHPDVPVVALAGIFRYKKGLNYLLEACAETEREFQLLLIGDFKSQKEKELHSLNYKRAVEKRNVVLTGMVPQGERFNYTSMADVVVVPSLFSEGCPSTLLEAMALGKPLVSTDAGACGEIIEDKKNGLLVGQANSLELRVALEKLLDCAEKRATLGREALKTAEAMSFDSERFRWKKVIDKVVDKVVGRVP